MGILHDGIAYCDTTLDTVDRAIQQQSARTRGHWGTDNNSHNEATQSFKGRHNGTFDTI